MLGEPNVVPPQDLCTRCLCDDRFVQTRGVLAPLRGIAEVVPQSKPQLRHDRTPVGGIKPWRGTRAVLRFSYATRRHECSRADALAGFEKRRKKFARPIDAGRVVAVNGMNRRTRNRLGELPLCVW